MAPGDVFFDVSPLSGAIWSQVTNKKKHLTIFYGYLALIFINGGEKPKTGPIAKIGQANFFKTLAGPFFDWAKNGCGWPSQRFFPQHKYLCSDRLITLKI